MSSAKIALVTGATRGIGRGIAEALLERGQRVVACARDARALEELRSVSSERVIPLPIDLAEQGAPEWVVDEAARLAGGLDQLVCAAGIVRYASVGHVREPDLLAQLSVNFVAPFLMVQRAVTHMRARGGGSVVLLGSTLAFKSAPQTAAYAASKAALLSATRSFALELAPDIRVNALAPGVVDTDMIRVSRAENGLDRLEHEAAIQREIEGLRALHPLARLGSVADIAQAALYLLDASWVTGSVLTIDGGLSAR